MIKKLIKATIKITMRVGFVLVLSLAASKVYDLLRSIPMTYHLAVIGEIDYSYSTRFEFAYMEFVLRTLADENDVVIILVDSPGGLCYLGYDLIHYIEFSLAKTISWTPRGAASMGAQIAFATTETHFKDTTKFLFHRPFMLVDGKVVRDGNEPVMAYSDSYTFRKVFKFLTIEQEAAYLNNKDVLVTGEQIITESQKYVTK